MIDIVFLAVMGLLIVASAFRPSVAVATALFGYTLEQIAQASSYFFVAQNWIGNVCMGLSVLVALVSLQFRGKRPLSNLSITFYLGVLLLAYATASTVWSLTPGGLSILIPLSPYIALNFLAFPLLIQSVDGLRSAMQTCAIVGACLYLVLVLTTSLAERGRSIKLAEAEASTLTETKDGNALAVASGAGYAAICAAFIRFRKGQTLLNTGRWLLVLLYLVVVVNSGSRGQLLACVFSIAVLMPIYFGVKDIGKLFRLAAVGCVFAGLVYGVYVVRLAESERWQLDFMSEQLESGRFRLWGSMLKEWSTSNPITILFGLGSFSYVTLVIHYPHNLTIEVLTEQGVLGATLGLAMLLSAVYAFKRLLGIYQGPEERAAIITLAGLALFELLLHQKQSSFFGISTLYMFLIGLGRCYAHSVSAEGVRQLRASQAAQLVPIQLVR